MKSIEMFTTKNGKQPTQLYSKSDENLLAHVSEKIIKG